MRGRVTHKAGAKRKDEKEEGGNEGGRKREGKSV